MIQRGGMKFGKPVRDESISRKGERTRSTGIEEEGSLELSGFQEVGVVAQVFQSGSCKKHPFTTMRHYVVYFCSGAYRSSFLPAGLPAING